LNGVDVGVPATLAHTSVSSTPGAITWEDQSNVPGLRYLSGVVMKAADEVVTDVSILDVAEEHAPSEREDPPIEGVTTVLLAES
jgi:hypothetical protein